MTTKAKAAPKRKVANSKRLPDGPDWTFELIERYHQEIRRVAELYRLDTYPNQIEIITSEQMMDAYSSIGMPINYTIGRLVKNSFKPSKPTNMVRWGWHTKL